MSGVFFELEEELEEAMGKGWEAKKREHVER